MDINAKLSIQTTLQGSGLVSNRYTETCDIEYICWIIIKNEL
jgi:hypothetical protein